MIKKNKQMTITKHLSNADLITILMQRDPKAEADIMIDYSLWDSPQKYTGIDEYDGVCFVKEHNRLVMSAGQFEC